MVENQISAENQIGIYIKNFKQKYSQLKKKYNVLPDWQEIDTCFEISTYIDEKKIDYAFPLRVVRRAIAHYFSSWCGYLHDILLPNPQSIVANEEHKIYDEKEKKEIVELLRLLFAQVRESQLLELEKDSKKNVLYIKEKLELWKSLEKRLKQLLDKSVFHWQKEGNA